MDRLLGGRQEITSREQIILDNRRNKASGRQIDKFHSIANEEEALGHLEIAPQSLPCRSPLPLSVSSRSIQLTACRQPVMVEGMTIL